MSFSSSKEFNMLCKLGLDVLMWLPWMFAVVVLCVSFRLISFWWNFKYRFIFSDVYRYTVL